MESSGQEDKIAELHGVMERFAQKLKNRLKTFENPYNLADGHIFVLMYLYRETWCRVTDVVKILGVTSGAATGLTDKLVSLGLIERFRPEDDRRVVQLSLTEKGKQIVEGIRKQRMQWFSELVGQLDEQNLNNMLDAFKQLLILLEKR